MENKRLIKRFKHGSWAWENEEMDKMREQESICLTCSWYKPMKRTNCSASHELFTLAKKYNMAFIVTRCGQCPNLEEEE